MKIAIIGTGYVGLVSGACFADKGHNVICMDIDEEKIVDLKSGNISIFEKGLSELIIKNQKNHNLLFTTSVDEAVNDADFVFICVGTPPNKDGSADLKYVLNAASEIGKYLSENTIVVTKSTVPVGTADKIKNEISKKCSMDFFVASNPEFLREGNAIDDFFNADRIVVGIDDDIKNQFEKLYNNFQSEMVFTDVKSAEMIKYASNAFLATKISFINEIANVCEEVGANVQDVANGMGLDKRIGKSFLNAGIGYGGSCFPKDVRALNQIAGENGYNFKLLKAVINVNNDQRWRFYEKIKQELNGISGKKIAVLGLAFKANTDDIRESIGIDYAKQFVKDGAQVSVYDSKAIDNAKKELVNVEFCSSIASAVSGVDAIVITTECNEFKEFDFSQVNKKVVIFDGRNILDVNKIKKDGFRIFNIG